MSDFAYPLHEECGVFGIYVGFLILLLFLLSFSNLDYVRYDPPVYTFIHLPASNVSSSRCRRSVTSSTDISCPVSRAMEVTPLSIKPQG